MHTHQEMVPEQRARTLKINLFKITYWQRRAKVAERGHRKRRLRELDVCRPGLRARPERRLSRERVGMSRDLAAGGFG
jgi:hypothetical protein